MGEIETEKPLLIAYKEEDLHFKCASKESELTSKFDEELCKRWDHAMEQGYFKYNLDSVESKIIPGKFGFVAQLNEKRFSQRRQPQHITDLSQPFDPEKFNFTKVANKEILVSLCPKHRTSLGKHIILINVSPLEYGNVLFVPNAYAQLPQVLTEEAILLSMEMVLLSCKRDFRVGFNSLCAFASVNHLHLHAFYSPHVLPVETAIPRLTSLLSTLTAKKSIKMKFSADKKVSCISNGFYETVDYPIKAFVFECCGVDNAPMVASIIHQVTSYLHKNDLAHNVFFTRGQLLSETLNSSQEIDALRIFVWARKSSIGIKNEDVLNIAVCELGGYLPIKERSWYNNMTEKDVCNYLKDAALDDKQYNKIKTEILSQKSYPQVARKNGHS